MGTKQSDVNINLSRLSRKLGDICDKQNKGKQFPNIFSLLIEEAKRNTKEYAFTTKEGAQTDLYSYLDQKGNTKTYLQNIYDLRGETKNHDSFYDVMIKCLSNINYEPSFTTETNIKEEYREILDLIESPDKDRVEFLLRELNKKRTVSLWELLIEVESDSQENKRQFYAIASNYISPNKRRTDINNDNGSAKGLTAFIYNSHKSLPVCINSRNKEILWKTEAELYDSWSGLEITCKYWHLPESNSKSKTMIIIPLLYEKQIAFPPGNLKLFIPFGILSLEFDTHFSMDDNDFLGKTLKEISQIITKNILRIEA